MIYEPQKCLKSEVSPEGGIKLQQYETYKISAGVNKS